jgi:hypothetical protein
MFDLKDVQFDLIAADSLLFQAIERLNEGEDVFGALVLKASHLVREALKKVNESEEV